MAQPLRAKARLALPLRRQLDYLYFDTGIMYRAVTCAALDRGVAISRRARDHSTGRDGGNRPVAARRQISRMAGK